MKKLAFITMIAALFASVPSTHAADNNGHAVEAEEVRGGEARIDFNQTTEILTITLRTQKEMEKVQVFIAHNGEVVVKDAFVAAGRPQTFEIDLTGFPSGVYNVKIASKTIGHGTRFKKK